MCTAISQTTLLPKCDHFIFADEIAAPGLSETFEHRRAMRLRHDKRIAAGGSNLFAA